MIIEFLQGRKNLIENKPKYWLKALCTSIFDCLSDWFEYQIGTSRNEVIVYEREILIPATWEEIIL